jgi:putative transposase
MPRRNRPLPDNAIFHVFNRGNCGMYLFSKPGDFASFIKALEQARQRFPDVRILGYCLLEAQWHLVLWPRHGRELSRFMGWLSSTHVRRWREHRDNVGHGHLYQGRFKSFLVQQNGDFLSLMRFIEGSPRSNGMVYVAQDWPWSSLNRAAGADGLTVAVTPWPIERPANWLKLVDQPMDEPTLARLRTSMDRGRPFGDENWTSRTVARLGLEATVRDPWRPRAKPAELAGAVTP